MKFTAPNTVKLDYISVSGTVTQSTRETSHSIFWIKDETGKETEYRYTNLRSLPVVGQTVSILSVCAIQGTERRLTQAGVINHNAQSFELLLGEEFFDFDDELKSIGKKAGWITLLSWLVSCGWILGFQVIVGALMGKRRERPTWVMMPVWYLIYRSKLKAIETAHVKITNLVRSTGDELAKQKLS